MKPLLRVVLSVLEPYVTGVASPLVKGEALDDLTLLMAARERKLRWKFSASCLEAIASARCGRGWRAVGVGWMMNQQIVKPWRMKFSDPRDPAQAQARPLQR